MSEEELERVARAICTNLGLDPDQQVGCGYGDCDTPAERAAYDGVAVPAVLLYEPRWRLYRGRAAVALATQAAIS